MTLAQIEIMQADLPHTLFRKDTKRPAPGGPTVKNDDAAFRKQEEANKKAAMRRARKGGQYTTDQLFEK